VVLKENTSELDHLQKDEGKLDIAKVEKCCNCCVSRMNFVKQIARVAEQKSQFDLLLLRSSVTAQPYQIAEKFAEEVTETNEDLVADTALIR